MDKMTTFSDTDSIPDGEYIIRVKIDTDADGHKTIAVDGFSDDDYLLKLIDFKTWEW